MKNLNSVFERRSECAYWLLERGFYVRPNWDGNEVASPRFAYLDFLGLDLVDGSFFSGGERIYGYNECSPDGANCYVKADNSSILYSFQALGAPVLVW